MTDQVNGTDQRDTVPTQPLWMVRPSPIQTHAKIVQIMTEQGPMNVVALRFETVHGSFCAFMTGEDAIQAGNVIVKQGKEALKALVVPQSGLFVPGT